LTGKLTLRRLRLGAAHGHFDGSADRPHGLPQGALFRKDADGRIRRALVEHDLIEAVIGLAPNIFYGTALAPAVVVLRRAKPVNQKGKVLVVDASNLFRTGAHRTSSTLNTPTRS
jgi:type I restriction enzyme M protein